MLHTLYFLCGIMLTLLLSAHISIYHLAIFCTNFLLKLKINLALMIQKTLVHIFDLVTYSNINMQQLFIDPIY